MDSNHCLDSLTSIHFNKKLVFSASQDLVSARSYGFVLPHTINETDMWSIKAHDFSPKLYRSLCVPRTKNKNIRLSLFKSGLSDIPYEVNRVTPVVLPEIERKKAPPFITWYRPPDALDYKMMFVKAGKHPSVAYKDPKPHNFRPHADDLPNIVTTTEKDPGHLNTKSQLLSAIGGTRLEPNIHQRDTVRRMHTFKPAEPRWDAQLVLPKTPWPPKSASYTRHRRRRGVYSSFMDRVEQRLTSSWKNK